MVDFFVSDDDRDRAEAILDRYEENPEKFEDISDEFLPPKIQKLFGEWLRNECSQEDLIDRLGEFSDSETGLFFVTLRNHYERKLKHIRDVAKPEIPA